MAYPVVIENARKKTQGLLLKGSVSRGDLIAYNGSTGWVQADASDAATNLYAQYVAMSSGVSGNYISGCKQCTFYDEDAPYSTVDATYYASGTAGAVTSTRPATDGDVIQVVGRNHSTKRLVIDIKEPTEVEVFIPCSPYNLLAAGTAVEAHAADGTTGEWAGADADSANISAVFSGYFPSGLIGAPLAADLIVNTQTATALSVDVTYVRAYIGGTNTGDAGVTKTALSTSTTTADNTIMRVSLLTGMDADFVKAGAPFGVEIDPDVGDFIILGLYMRYLVV